MRCSKGEDKEAFNNPSLVETSIITPTKPCNVAGLLEQSVVSPAKNLNIKYWGNYEETGAHRRLTFGRKAPPGFTLRLEFWHCWPWKTGSRLPQPHRDQDLKQEGAPVASCNQCRSCDEGHQAAPLWDEQLKQWKWVDGFFLRGF